MKCLFCDCPGYGYYGNISVDDLKYQIRTILDNVGSTHTQYFGVDFMRMGEPTLNPNILDFIEFELSDLIRSKVDADIIVPSISTMLPRNKAAVADFLQRYCRIKNEVYDGNADLQFSICTTDETIRRSIYKIRLFPWRKLRRSARPFPCRRGISIG